MDIIFFSLKNLIAGIICFFQHFLFQNSHSEGLVLLLQFWVFFNNFFIEFLNSKNFKLYLFLTFFVTFEIGI